MSRLQQRRAAASPGKARQQRHRHVGDARPAGPDERPRPRGRRHAKPAHGDRGVLRRPTRSAPEVRLSTQAGPAAALRDDDLHLRDVAASVSRSAICRHAAFRPRVSWATCWSASSVRDRPARTSARIASHRAPSGNRARGSARRFDGAANTSHPPSACAVPNGLALEAHRRVIVTENPWETGAGGGRVEN